MSNSTSSGPLGGSYLNPYIIAEVGVNHEGSLDLARELIHLAARGGAHAVKFQSYKAGTIASKNSPSYWDLDKEPTTSQYDLFKKYDAFGPEEYGHLKDHCDSRQIDFLSTPFDLNAVEYLDPIMKVFKIASADITNVPLLRTIAAKKKPILLSTGASTIGEIEFALRTIRAVARPPVTLLHCVLNYPTPAAHAQLAQINVLKKAFPDCPVGYSDHTVPGDQLSALETASLLGAVVLEKHFTHDKTLPGNDHYHAMDAGDCRRFVKTLARHREMYGSEERDLSNQERAIIHARRSIVALRAIRKNEILSEEMLIAKRPGHGISPAAWDRVVGKRVVRDIAEDQLLTWADLDDSAG